MSLFDKEYSSENNFAKSNPNYLNSMFGTTDVMPLWIADMDFKVAEPISKELKRLVDRGIYGYEFNTQDVFSAIANWYLKRHNLSLDTDAFVQVPGVLSGISLLIRELSEINDGVLIQTPVYHQFNKLITTAKRKVIENPLKIVDGNYEMDFEDLELKLERENVKLILLCNPHNPVGRVWNKNEMQKLTQLANKYDVRIISDEIHADIIYSKNKFNSIASIDKLKKHIAVIGSPAKTFGMQSISNGYLYIHETHIQKQFKSLIDSMYLDHGNVFSTYATIAAYTKGENWVNELIVHLEKSNKWIKDFIHKELPEVKMFIPEGTYQVWLDFNQLGLSDEGLKHLLINKAKLALTPGSWFGGDHSQFMRINMASPLVKIQEAFYQLKRAVKEE